MNRFFTDPKDILTLADGTRIAVTTEWGHNSDNFVARAQELGWEIVQVY